MSKDVKNTPYYEFFKLEMEMGLFSLDYNGVNYWQLVRFGLLKGITVKGLHVVSNSTNRNLKNEIIKTIQRASKIKKKYNQLSKVDIVRLRPCIAVTSDGNQDDHQFDYVQLQNNYHVLDLYALGFYTEEYSCVDYDMSPAENEVILWKIKRKFVGAGNIAPGQEELIKKFLFEINKIYGTKFNIEDLKSTIQYAVRCHLIYKKWFIKIFRQISPKILMEYPHYDEHMFAATAAARELGIKVIEFQHGRINAHEAYWYEDQENVGKILPDYFFTYGEWWNEQIHLPDFCKVVAVGNAYLEKQLELYPRKSGKRNTVAVFSNPQNGKVLSEFIYGLNDYFVKKNIRVLYKLHPNEREIWKKEYPLLSQLENTIVYEVGSVYNILSDADFAIAINSTVLFEALAYNSLSLFVYTIGDYEGMKPLIENGMAIPVNSIEEMQCFMNKLRDENCLKDATGKKMWKENAITSTEYVISEIMKSVL